MSTQVNNAPSKSPGPTTRLSTWVSSLQAQQIPEEIITRAKYLILDGIGCGLVGAHLPWSEKAAHALFALEPEGDAMIIGWNRKLPPMTAALLNGSFIQGFELDDWHSEAPLHSCSILLPALLAATQHVRHKNNTPTSGAAFLLAAIVGFEVGPRVGLGLWGSQLLSSGWHSGAVFGPAAAAAAVSRLLGLNAEQTEDAFGIACTQACGLMSAQFGSEVKRMQHGFAARNGVLAAFLAQGGYTGIHSVFEVEYGGFLKQFSLGNGRTPPYLAEEIDKELGSTWKTRNVRIKPYSAMAGTHPTVDCIRKLQAQHPEQMKRFADITSITLKLGDVAFHHGGWKATRPLTATGAQMSNSFVAATQIVHGQVLPAQFRSDMLVNDDVWRLVDLTTCEEERHGDDALEEQAAIVTFKDGSQISARVHAARGVDPPLSNEEIVDKYRALTASVMDKDAAAKIESIVLSLDKLDDMASLEALLGAVTQNPIA